MQIRETVSPAIVITFQLATHFDPFLMSAVCTMRKSAVNKCCRKYEGKGGRKSFALKNAKRKRMLRESV